MHLICIDTETIGLPTRKGGFDDYSHYSETSNYDSCRVIEIGYVIFNSHGRIMKKVNHLIKPVNIKIENSHIHGITQELAEKNGIKMYDALKELEEDLKYVDTIVAHNLLFDYNIILSECYRLNFNNLIYKIESLNKSCTMKLGRKVIGLGKYPKLSVLYEFLFQKEIVQEHRALSDVLFCLDCYIKMVELLNLDMNGCRKIEEKNICL